MASTKPLSPYHTAQVGGSLEINDVDFNIDLATKKSKSAKIANYNHDSFNENDNISKNGKFDTSNRLHNIEQEKAPAKSDKDSNQSPEPEVGEVSLEKPKDFQGERVFYLARNKRIAIFCFIITVNIIANFDDGIIPAATEEIRVKLGVDKDLVGLLGTLTYTGNLIGKIYIF
jgi:hypothetical protein